MSQVIRTPDATLEAAFAATAASLDTHARAWIIGVGRFLDRPSPTGPRGDDAVLERAFASGFYPAGPFPFGQADLRQDPAVPAGRRTQFQVPCGGTMECRIWAGQPDGVVEALTRTGCLTVGASIEPSHVMLSDVEAVLTDTLVLLESRATEAGYTGLSRIMIGVASEVPGAPLELRVFDEGDGERLRPPAGYNDFDPVVVEYSGRLGLPEGEQLLWDASLAISLRFGVFAPQLVNRPGNEVDSLADLVSH